MEALLNSKAINLVMSSEFVRKKEFKLKKIKRLIYIRNMNRMFNKKEIIKYTIKVNIYYQGYRKRMKIDMIREQKYNFENTMAYSS